MTVYSRIFLVLSVIASSDVNIAFANDTSWPIIEVDEIQTDTKVGSYISFSGEESKKLMQVLPPRSSVLGKEVDSHHKSLNILSPNYMVSIDCTDRADRTSTIPMIPHCRIIFDTRWSGPDTISFEPEQQCSAKAKVGL